ncbi:MAG: hypothetical protein KGV57_01360 [Fusobacterium sp.]|nr:hypothetical protein [Fusobacterium sp.]
MNTISRYQEKKNKIDENIKTVCKYAGLKVLRIENVFNGLNQGIVIIFTEIVDDTVVSVMLNPLQIAEINLYKKKEIVLHLNISDSDIKKLQEESDNIKRLGK